jgi:hypothetical protein
MRIPFRILLLAVAFPLVPPIWAQSEPLVQAPKPPFSVSISLEQEVVKAGSEVRLDIVLTNTSDENIVIAGWEDQNCEIYEIEVYDSHDERLHQLNECLPTKDSPDHPGSTTICVTASSPMIRTCVPKNQLLKPHGVIKEDMLVNNLYDLRQPGKYTIQVQRVNDPRTFRTVPGKLGDSREIELHSKINDVSRATVKSNTVVVTVEPTLP